MSYVKQELSYSFIKQSLLINPYEFLFGLKKLLPCLYLCVITFPECGLKMTYNHIKNGCRIIFATF